MFVLPEKYDVGLGFFMEKNDPNLLNFKEKKT